jgi:molybdate transport system substrate-binding protein
MKTTVKVLAAGSMRHALPEIIEAFTEITDIAVSLSLGPAGLLRERIEAGEAFDLFISANMAHPSRLASTGLAREPTCFARNRLCAIARADLGLTTENFIDRLSNPTVKIGTSTPGDDPSGDYAFEMFDRVEARHPNVGEALKARALQLVGGRNSPTAPPGKEAGYLITDGEVDLMLSYYTNGRQLQANAALAIVDIPADFAPDVQYGLALSAHAPVEAEMLQNFILADSGRDILEQWGFAAPQ